MDVYGTNKEANSGCRLTDITLEWRQFTVGFSVCMVITKNTINLENDQTHPLRVEVEVE